MNAGKALRPAGLRCGLTIVLLLFITAAAAQEADWQSTVKAEVAKKNLAGAALLVEQRLSADPGDLEARAWRARLLAWSGRWPVS